MRRGAVPSDLHNRPSKRRSKTDCVVVVRIESVIIEMQAKHSLDMTLLSLSTRSDPSDGHTWTVGWCLWKAR